jgi:hypothetical protein
MIFGFVSKKKYDDLKEKYDTEYYNAKATVEHFNLEVLNLYYGKEKELIECQAKYTEEVRKNIVLTEKLSLLGDKNNA